MRSGSSKRKSAESGGGGISALHSIAPVLGALALLAALMFASGIGRGDLFNETDGQYASAAVRMVDGGNWLIPENNGVPRLVKPPFLVWLMAASFAAFGENEAAARLPGALGITAWVLATAFLAWRMTASRIIAFFSGAILLTSLGMFTLGRIIMPESWFCAWITIALAAGFEAVQGGRASRKVAVVFWSACALACFTKGWHGLLLPVVILTAACAVLATARRAPGPLAALRGVLLSPQGWAVFVLVNVPWLVWIEFRFPGFLRHFFLAEGLGHVTGSDAPDTRYSGTSRPAFLILHGVWLFPWILVFLCAIPGWWRSGSKAINPARALLWCWFGVGIGVLMAAGQRQDYYGMFLWPVFAIATASLLAARLPRSAAAVLFVLGVAGLAAAAGFGVWSSWLPGQTGALVERETASDALSEMGVAVWEPMLPLLWITAAAWTVCGALSWWAARPESSAWNRAGAALWLAAAVATSLAGAEGMARIAPFFSHGTIGRWLRDNAPDGAEICFEGGIDTGSSLLFYSGRARGNAPPLRLLDAAGFMEFATRKHGIGAGNYWTRDELLAAWESDDPVYLVIEDARISHWKILLPGARLLRTQGTQALLANLPAPGRASGAVGD